METDEATEFDSTFTATIRSKEPKRRLIEWQTECFLKAGGKVEQVPGFGNGRRLKDLPAGVRLSIATRVGMDPDRMQRKITNESAAQRHMRGVKKGAKQAKRPGGWNNSGERGRF